MQGNINVDKCNPEQLAGSRPLSEPATDGVKQSKKKKRLFYWLPLWLAAAGAVQSADSRAAATLPHYYAHSTVGPCWQRLPFTSMIGLVITTHHAGPFHLGDPLQTCVQTQVQKI